MRLDWQGSATLKGITPLLWTLPGGPEPEVVSDDASRLISVVRLLRAECLPISGVIDTTQRPDLTAAVREALETADDTPRPLTSSQVVAEFADNANRLLMEHNVAGERLLARRGRNLDGTQRPIDKDSAEARFLTWSRPVSWLCPVGAAATLTLIIVQAGNVIGLLTFLALFFVGLTAVYSRLSRVSGGWADEMYLAAFNWAYCLPDQGPYFVPATLRYATFTDAEATGELCKKDAVYRGKLCIHLPDRRLTRMDSIAVPPSFGGCPTALAVAHDPVTDLVWVNGACTRALQSGRLEVVDPESGATVVIDEPERIVQVFQIQREERRRLVEGKGPQFVNPEALRAVTLKPPPR